MEKIVYKRSPRKWTEDREVFLKENYKSMPYIEISNRLGMTLSAIAHKAQRLGLDSRSLWTDEENSIILNEYSCNPDIWTRLKDRSREAIQVQARKLGVQRECGNYSINYRFFETWTPQSAYVIGFFLADGCVEPHLNRISCELSMKDYDHLINIKNLMKSQNPICIKKTRYACALFIHNAKMVSDIIQKGVIPNKTTRVRLPDIPQEYFKDVLRGYIDGDGSIWFDDGRKRFQILGNLGFVTDINNKLMSKYGFAGSIYEHNKKLNTQNCYRLQLFKKDDIKILLDDIYYDNCFALTRKLGLARGVIPGKINSTQISQANSSSIGEPERKTDFLSGSCRDQTWSTSEMKLMV